MIAPSSKPPLPPSRSLRTGRRRLPGWPLPQSVPSPCAAAGGGCTPCLRHRGRVCHTQQRSLEERLRSGTEQARKALDRAQKDGLVLPEDPTPAFKPEGKGHVG